MGSNGPSRRDWVSMSLAGTLLGLTFALACSATFAKLPIGLAPQIHAQLTMWVVPPIWFSVLCGVFALQTGPRAWKWLAVANAGALAIAALTFLL